MGDDAAVVRPGPGLALLTTDMSVAGVHADLALVELDDLGWRAVAVSLSDIAAMGGTAARLVVAAAGPPLTDMDRLLAGVAEAAASHRCPIVGGDLSGGGEVTVVVSVLGRVDEEPGPVLRGGARAGDHLFVTAPLGAGAAGLRTLRETAAGGDGLPSSAARAVAEAYRRPRARLGEGVAARRAGATAMIDVSDGLAADLGHLASESGVGFRLHHVPVAPGATREEALGGGDDYELVFAAPDADRVASTFVDEGLAPPIPIGVCTADGGERRYRDEVLEARGWEHRWD